MRLFARPSVIRTSFRVILRHRDVYSLHFSSFVKHFRFIYRHSVHCLAPLYVFILTSINHSFLSIYPRFGYIECGGETFERYFRLFGRDQYIAPAFPFQSKSSLKFSEVLSSARLISKPAPIRSVKQD